MAGPILLGDLGGTHCRFALLGDDGKPTQAHAYDDDDFTGVADVISHYVKEIGVAPSELVLAAAAPVTGSEIKLTNRDWAFRLDDLKARFGLARVRAVNDFEAQAWALPLLGPEDVISIGKVTTTPQGPMAVLGPGTGLGVAALLPTGGGWFAVPSEAGHVSFGPASTEEVAVFARVQNANPVSAETVLSGPGLERVHAALHPGAASASAAEIVTAAQAGDARARASVDLFVRLLGRFAGDIALVFKATGGVYVTGGVAQALGDAFDVGIFRQAFEAHPPYAALLATVPTNLIIRRQPGLLGCAVLARAG